MLQCKTEKVNDTSLRAKRLLLLVESTNALRRKYKQLFIKGVPEILCSCIYSQQTAYDCGFGDGTYLLVGVALGGHTFISKTHTSNKSFYLLPKRYIASKWTCQM